MKFDKFLSEAPKLNGGDIKEKIIQFVIDNPDPSDERFHKFAEDLGYEESHAVETIAYSLLSDFWCFGRWQKEGQDIKFDAKQLADGVKIEMEHTRNRILAERIARDHLSEFAQYYVELKKMEEKMIKENK